MNNNYFTSISISKRLIARNGYCAIPNLHRALLHLHMYIENISALFEKNLYSLPSVVELIYLFQYGIGSFFDYMYKNLFNPVHYIQKLCSELYNIDSQNFQQLAVN